MQKVAWITGASSGIGEELAIQLNNLGYRLILSARNEDKLIILSNKLKNGQNHIVCPLDLSKTLHINEIVSEIFQTVPHINELYNVSGVSQRATASETELDVVRQIMEVNFFGTVALTKAILPHFQKQQFGKICVVSSIAGKFGFYLRSSYSAAKHALHGYFESLALEEAKNNIHVTIVCPGKINTPISTNALTSTGDKHGVMDHNQKTGMPVEKCVLEIIKAVQENKREVLIGGKELLAVKLKRFFPTLFWKVIAKQSAT